MLSLFIHILIYVCPVYSQYNSFKMSTGKKLGKYLWNSTILRPNARTSINLGVCGHGTIFAI